MAASFPAVALSELSDKECPVCRDVFGSDPSDFPVRLPCKHIVGATCIKEWQSYDMTCPMCRASLRTVTNYGSNQPSRTRLNRINADMIRAIGNDGFFDPYEAICVATAASNDVLLDEALRKMGIIPTPHPRPINTGVRAVTNEWLYYTLLERLQPRLDEGDGWIRDVLGNLWTFWIIDLANDHPARFRHDRHPGNFNFQRQHSVEDEGST